MRTNKEMPTDKPTVQILLQKLGFTPAQAETYWALLHLEAVSVRKVAAASGINRGTTYDAMRALVAAGLVHVRKKGEREYFAAETPDKIYDLIRERRKELLETQQTAQKIVPELMARQVRPQGRPLVKYHEDDEGVATILRDVLQTCARLESPEYCVYSSRPLRKYLYRKFPQFTARRIREGVRVKVIALGAGSDTEGLSERKWLPGSDNAEIASYSIIYGDKVAHISITSDYTPYGVVIEDTGAAAMQRALFEQLWRAL